MVVDKGAERRKRRKGEESAYLEEVREGGEKRKKPRKLEIWIRTGALLSCFHVSLFLVRWVVQPTEHIGI